MEIMGLMNRARGTPIFVENGFHVRMVFLLFGVLLSIPTASGQDQFPPPPGAFPPTPDAFDRNPSPSPPPPPPPASPNQPLPGGSSAPGTPSLPSPSPPPDAESPKEPTSLPSPSPPPDAESPKEPSPSPLGSPPPAPGNPAVLNPSGDTWNESEKAGVVIASIAALLQVAVVAFLLIKRHQMLTTVEYDDIEDMEYETPPDSNFRDIVSA